jgi:hypothetical protein
MPDITVMVTPILPTMAVALAEVVSSPATFTPAVPGVDGATNLSYIAATRVIASDTGTDATLPLVTTGNAGLAPASGGGTANFLRADGTWAAPAGGGSNPLPVGGTTGQSLLKVSGTDFDVAWGAPTIDWAAVTGKPATFAPSAHSHIIADVTGLQSALDGKQASGAYLLPAAIGVTVQGYNVSTVIDAAYVHTDNNFTAAQVSKLAGIAAGATVNSADATLLARANHTGTQLAATISDFSATVAATAAVTANTAKVTNATHTGDVTGATSLTIANDVVTNAKLANMVTASIKGRTTAGTGDPEDLTGAQVRTLLNVADGATANSADATLLARANHTGTQAQSTVVNLVSDLALKAPLASPTFTGTVVLPAGQVVNGVTLTTGGGTSNFLRADGTYAAPAGGGATNLSYTAATRVIASDTGTDATLPLVTTGDAGLAPASGGGTTNFLRADGSWAAPAGGGGAVSPALYWVL